MFYDAQYACSDHLFDYLLELSYVRRLNNTVSSKLTNAELMMMPTIYDSPDKHNRQKLSY